MKSAHLRRRWLTAEYAHQSNVPDKVPAQDMLAQVVEVAEYRIQEVCERYFECSIQESCSVHKHYVVPLLVVLSWQVHVLVNLVSS